MVRANDQGSHFAFSATRGALAAWCVPGTRLPADHHPSNMGAEHKKHKALIRTAVLDRADCRRHRCFGAARHVIFLL
jgi:hypothetical protein